MFTLTGPKTPYTGVYGGGMNTVTWGLSNRQSCRLFKCQENFQAKVTSEIFLQGKSERVGQNREV